MSLFHLVFYFESVLTIFRRRVWARKPTEKEAKAMQAEVKVKQEEKSDSAEPKIKQEE